MGARSRRRDVCTCASKQQLVNYVVEIRHPSKKYIELVRCCNGIKGRKTKRHV